MNPASPHTRILALDIGEKRTGIALSDETCIISSPLIVLPMKPRKKFIAELIRIILENDVAEVVVGIPLNDSATQIS